MNAPTVQWKMEPHGLMYLITRPPTEKERELFDLVESDPRGMSICGITKDDMACINCLDDAELILRAVNNHASLLAALADITERLDRVGDSRKDNDVISAAYAAIAKAEGPL